MSAEVHDHEHHHKQNFISKYIFSLDHKMIAKQYLITGIIMGIIGVGMSLLLECNWRPEESFRILNVLGDKWAPNGVMTNDIYLSLVDTVR
jgi:cytochrome c oxidase subunit 1